MDDFLQIYYSLSLQFDVLKIEKIAEEKWDIVARAKPKEQEEADDESNE